MAGSERENMQIPTYQFNITCRCGLVEQHSQCVGSITGDWVVELEVTPSLTDDNKDSLLWRTGLVRTFDRG